MSKPDAGHSGTHLTFSQEHNDHVDTYRYQEGSDKRDSDYKDHSPTSPGMPGGSTADIPVRTK